MSDASPEKKTEREYEPYAAEYAKSNRSACKVCKEKIEKGVLRLVVRFPAPGGHGLATHWHHVDCFWSKKRKFPTEENFYGFEQLTPEDQEQLRTHFKEDGDVEKPEDFVVKGPIPKVEHAKSAGGKCFKCKEPIAEAALRVSHKVAFYHPQCFAAADVYKDAAESFDGFGALTEDEQKTMQDLFKKPAGAPEKRKATDSPSAKGTPTAKKTKPAVKKEKEPKKEKPAKKKKPAKYDSDDDFIDDSDSDDGGKAKAKPKQKRSKKKVAAD